MLLTVLFLMAYPQSHTSPWSQSGTRQWPGSDVWPVTASGRGRLDNNRLFHYFFQPLPGRWPLTGHTRDSLVITRALIWYLGNGDPDCDQASAHSLSHYIVPESHRPHALTPVREIDVNPEWRHFKVWVKLIPSPVTRISFPRSNFSNKLWRLERDKTSR